jgi:hypothetical protein
MTPCAAAASDSIVMSAKGASNTTRRPLNARPRPGSRAVCGRRRA